MTTWSHGVRSLLIAVATAVTLSADAEEKESAPYAAEMNGKYYATLAKAVIEDDGTTLRFVYDGKSYGEKDTDWFSVAEAEAQDVSKDPPWYRVRTQLTKVVFDDSFRNYRPRHCSHWFVLGYSSLRYDQLTEIEGLANLDVSEAVYLGYMFSGCTLLRSLDVSGFNTANVGDMECMFETCKNLAALDVSGFNTVNVTNMYKMFSECKKLTVLDVSGFDTSACGNMEDMFWDCESLEVLDVSGFDTSACGKMESMFYGCESLEVLDVAGFNTSKVMSMDSMFAGCESLTELNVSGFDTSQVRAMGHMFEDCKKLTTLDVSGFDTRNVTFFYGMFSGCSSLASLDVSGFKTSAAYHIGAMFQNCSSLTAVDVSGFDTSNVTYMFGVFQNCAKLTTLDVSNFDTSKVWDFESMFSGCSSLVTIYGPSAFDLSSINRIDYSDIIFRGCTSLVGGQGTTNATTRIRVDYARIDGGELAPGYFTAAVPALVTVTFDANGGVVGETSRTVVKGDKVGELPMATQDGYTFLGWFTALSGGQRVEADTVVRENVTYHAQWEANPVPDPDPTPVPGPDPKPKQMPTLFDSFAPGAVSEKGATYNGFLGEETFGGTFTLVVKKPKKGETMASATLTKVNPLTGKKEKVTGTVDVTTGVCAGGLAGLELNATGVGGKLGDLTAQGAVDAVKAKDQTTLGLMNGFDKSVYSVVLKGANGSCALLTATFSKKGKVKVAGTVDGVKISCSAQMSVGDRYAAVPFAYAKPAKGIAISAVLWFEKETKKLVDVTGVGAGFVPMVFGDASAPDSGAYRFLMAESDVLASVPGVISNTAYEVKVTFDGKKYDAGKAAKVKYDKKTSTLAVDTSKGTDVSGLKLKYAKGAISGSFTVYEIDTTKQKLVKNKFTVNGVIVNGVGHGLATNKKLKPIWIEVVRQ